MNGQFYAKSILQNGKQPTVKEHLQDVSQLAFAYGSELSMGEATALTGLLHDFGKYSSAFQKVLQGERSVNHAICGAVLLDHMCGNRSGFHKAIEAIAAHHSALASYYDLKNTLDALWSETQPMEVDGREAALIGEETIRAAYDVFCRDFPDFRLSKAQMVREFSGESNLVIGSLKSMLRTRMLFSCLVDADYTASAQEEDETYLERSEAQEMDFSAAIQALDDYRARLAAHSDADQSLNRLRGAVFEACSTAASLEPGLFRLTAPTGTGKTLALLNFALYHCKKWGKTRIVLVLPFLSLTEQSAKIYRDLLPDLLEDTSQSELSEDVRLYASRWRVPVIVTTSVKFFESLFADRPTDCRRLHNLANSVILFDEAQTLPPELTPATIHAAWELCREYGCSMVFSTATQPEYSAIKTLEQWAPREILPGYASLYATLKRTEVRWRINDDEKVAWSDLAQELQRKRSVCTIVNVRKHARLLYQELRALCAEEEAFYLTTDLCPAHRSQVIETVRSRLAAGLSCRVVSTQCIEAGVDLDFDAVYRALAPLDSVIQAAGRCNRNGRHAGLGQVVVFRPEDEEYPGIWYQNTAETVRRFCADHPIDIHDPSEIQHYYAEIFSKLQGKSTLEKAIEKQDYRAVAQEYQLIEKQGAQVIVPFSRQMSLYDEIRKELEQGITPAIMQKAAPITVACYADEKLEVIAERIPFRKMTEGMSSYYVLRPQFLNCYQDDMGLQIPDKPQGKLFL